MSTYEIVSRRVVEANEPEAAAQEALAAEFGEDRFAAGFESYEVIRIEDEEEIPEGFVLVFGPPEESPVRPSGRIDGDAVRCGHCDSGNVRYVEDVPQLGRISVEDGIAKCRLATLEAQSPTNCRLWCEDCNGESLLPVPFQLIGGTHSADLASTSDTAEANGGDHDADRHPL